MFRILAVLYVVAVTALSAQPGHPASPAQAPHSRHFENTYLSLQILPGWTIAPPNPHAQNCCILKLARGRYVLAINPLFGHASGVNGGRMSEIIAGQPNVDAVLGDDVEDYGVLCAQSWDIPVTKDITLRNLYIGPGRKSADCPVFAAEPVWFASFFGGEGPESDYNITLTYESTDINALPRKDSPELAQVLDQVVRMLRTLDLKPPVVITKIVPTSAPAGATVTVYGHGFALPGQAASAAFKELPNSARLVTRVAPDGRSLTFVVPASITRIPCPPGKTEVSENCVVTPPGHIDINDCPPDQIQSCSLPIPLATYHISILEEGMSIWSNAVPFTLTASPPAPVSLLLLYPAYWVQLGDSITLRGRGFTSTANTVHIGATLIQDLSSTDGSIRFAVPHAASSPFQTLPVFVSNANGVSNVLTLTYR